MTLPVSITQRLDAEVDPAFAKRSEWILKKVQALHPTKVLDAGCGRGFYVSCLTEFPFIKKINGIDLNEEYLKKAKKWIQDERVTLEKADVYTLPFAANSFDLVMSSEVMEHLPDDVKALQALKRIIKPGGHLLITVPHENFPFLWDPLNWILMKFGTHVPKDIWWLAGMWADHERLYSLEQLKNVAKQAGWKIKETNSVIHYAWSLSHFWLYGVGKNIVEQLGSDQFNRFNPGKKPLSEFLAKVMAWPSNFDPKNMDGVSSVDLMILLQKEN